MENNIQIIGNEESVIYYNLNKQFSNLNKVIITKEIIINSFEDEDLKTLIYKLKSSLPKEYLDSIKEEKEIFNNNFRQELYKEIQESLNKISNNYMDVKLDNYNFMNSISNSKFNITLRCEHFSITNYYIEKGAILSNIKHLLKDYLHFTGNLYRLSRLDNFQIEISESDEIYKHILLKKENNSILLGSTFGFPKNTPINYSIGHEFYVSKGNDFKFFKNKQTNAILREHNKLVDKEINQQEKILTNEELVLVNEKTKGIDDALIECYINSKGQFKIANISIIENPLNKYSDNGIIISKSNKNYDRISILSLRDDFKEESMNPKYLLLKNEGDIKEFISDIRRIEEIDGIIITKNFYNKFLDRIGKNNNLDIIYLDKNVDKSLDEKIDWETIDIENSYKKEEGTNNPFNQILKEQQKEKDELLERLKNIDLSTPKKEDIDYKEPNARRVQNNADIQNVVNSIIGSEQSSFNKQNNNNGGNSQMMGNNKKKSAFDFLMDSAMDQKEKNEQIRRGEVPTTQAQNATQAQAPPIPEANHTHTEEQRDLNRYTSSSIPNPQTSEVRETITVEQDLKITESIDIEKYETVIATELIGEPGTNSDAYFADINTISQISQGKVYFLTLNPEEMQNPNLNYVLPIGLNNPQITNCSLLIKNLADYFLINKDQDVNYFVNIAEINDIIKKKFVEEIINKVGLVSLICNKKDLDLFEDLIDRIKAIRIRDIESEYDLADVKRKLLSFEKRKLMRN